MASTTSLTVVPILFLSRLTSFSDAAAKATRRRACTATLMDVRGAVSGSAALPAGSLRRMARMPKMLRVVRTSMRPTSNGATRPEITAWDTSSKPEGMRESSWRAEQVPGRAGGGLGLEVEEHAEQLGARDAVDGAVVHLDDQGNLPVLEPLDDPHLPQGPVPVQLAADDVGREVAQLAHPARRGQRRPPEVVVDVELGVVHPDREAQAHGHLDEAALEDRDLGDAVVDELADAPERVAVRHGRGVEDGDHGHVHVQGGRLHVEEARIEPCQAFGGHDAPSTWTWSSVGPSVRPAVR